MNFFKTKWPLALAFMLIAFSPACTDLEEEVFTQLTPATFPTNADEVTAAVAFAYSQLYGWGNHGGFNSLSEVSSDEIMIAQRGSDWFDGGIWLRAHRHDFKPNDGPVDGAWNFVFGGIAQANATLSLLDNARESGIVDAETVTQFAAEVKLIRALYYMWAVDGFGNVPIVTQDTEDSTPDTAPRAEVYNFIESEITAELANLSRDVAGTYARMNYYVANAMLAKLYINAEVYTGTPQWSKAVDAANVVIEGGYMLEGDYFANFNRTNDSSSEIVFAIPYDENTGQGFNISQMTLHYSSQETFQLQEQPWNGYCTLQEFYDSYDDTDMRKGVSGDQQTRGNFHAGPQYAPDGVTPILDSSSDDPGGAELVFTPEVNEHFPGTFRQAGARVGKYEFYADGMQSLSVDYPVFRYADILMLKAEALHRQSAGSGEALALVNDIRDRAGVDAFTEINDENLLAERGRELFYEGWRRNDLIRFGRFNDEWAFKTMDTPDNPDVGTVRFDADVQLFPIPVNQLNANPDLKQNDGY